MKKVKRCHSIAIEGDVVHALYQEGPVDVREIGAITKAEKISDVKFDPRLQSWTAVDRKTGKVIARDRSRKTCVEKEHAYYEREIARGRAPWDR